MDPATIRFIHDARTAAERLQLQADARTGDVAVLMGSTEKMGTGTNVQTRLIALHHVDVPWRPADLEQREGRIIRQGNQNPEVEVLNYVAEGTYDTRDVAESGTQGTVHPADQTQRGRRPRDRGPRRRRYRRVRGRDQGHRHR